MILHMSFGFWLGAVSIVFVYFVLRVVFSYIESVARSRALTVGIVNGVTSLIAQGIQKMRQLKTAASAAMGEDDGA